jgi:hypothetical protein
MDARWPIQMMDGEMVLFRVGPVDVSVSRRGRYYLTFEGGSCALAGVGYETTDWHFLSKTLPQDEIDQIYAVKAMLVGETT